MDAHPPRRATVRPIDGHDLPLIRPEWASRLAISLDGEEQRKVIGYDADAGYLVAYETDGAGKIRIEGNHAVTVTRTGTVAVAWRT